MHVDIKWEPERRLFILEPDTSLGLDDISRKVPGAQIKMSGRCTAPEISVVNISVAYCDGKLPPAYKQWLHDITGQPDISVIDPVTPGGRKLYRWQREDAACLYNRSFATFADPGCGKSCCIGAAFHAMLRDKLCGGLVWVMPLQTITQIQNELRKFFNIESASADKWDGEPVLLINPHKTYRDLYASKVERHLKENNAVLCYDEAQTMGNSNLHSDQVMRWRHIARVRWASSGTPIQNGIRSFFRIYKFVTNADVTPEAWDKKFVRLSDGRAIAKTIKELLPIRETFGRRRRKSDPDVAMNLPPLSIEFRRVPLTGRQLALYKDVKKNTLVKLKDMNEDEWGLWVKSPLARLTRELQVCRDPRLLGEGLSDKQVAKTQPLEDTMAHLEGHKVVVWSGHPAILDRVAQRFNGVAYHGQCSPTQKEVALARFYNDPACRVFAANPSVAGFGLDGLQNVSSNAILLDLPDETPHYKQLIDRLHRQGQKHRVTLYVILTEDTIEEWQYTHLMRKQREADFILGDVGTAQNATLSRKELMDALRK